MAAVEWERSGAAGASVDLCEEAPERGLRGSGEPVGAWLGLAGGECDGLAGGGVLC